MPLGEEFVSILDNLFLETGEETLVTRSSIFSETKISQKESQKAYQWSGITVSLENKTDIQGSAAE